MILTTFKRPEINFSYLIIIILVIIIFLQRSCTPDCEEIKTVTTIETVRDTVYIESKQVIDKKVEPVKVIAKKPPKKPEYTPSEHIDTCKLRFDRLLKEHSKLSIYKDTIFLKDNIGTITVVDSVWMNKLLTRRIIDDYKIPVVTVTNTITIEKEKEPVSQLYIGGNLYGNKTSLDMATPGLIFKTKKDNLYQFNAGINFQGQVTYGAGVYWKIKLKK